MSKRIAIDIALLPSDEVMQKAIDINQSLDTEKIDFNRELPHISLLMGVIDEADIPRIMEELEEIANVMSPLDLEIVSIQEVINKAGEIISSFQIPTTSQLQSLHESLVEVIQPYFKKEINLDMLYESPQAEKWHLDYIQGFTQNSSFENFDPHITLGVGQPEKTELSFSFQASRLALCHLGDYCTCRKVLGEYKLT